MYAAPVTSADARAAHPDNRRGMTPELLLTLGALALADSLSVGTLLIPVFFLIAPRLRADRMLVYLGTIATFYLLVGIALLLGTTTVLAALPSLMDSPVRMWLQLLVGAALLIAAFAIPTKRREGDAGPGRLARWRESALSSTSPVSVIGIALAAGALELATMVPYLAAIGTLTTSPVEPAMRVALLAGYCAVMILPALVLLVARVVARPLVGPPLRRFGAWLERTGRESTAWILGIVGVLVARGAATELGLFEALGQFLAR